MGSRPGADTMRGLRSECPAWSHHARRNGGRDHILGRSIGRERRQSLNGVDLRNLPCSSEPLGIPRRGLTDEHESVMTRQWTGCESLDSRSGPPTGAHLL